MTQSKKIMIPLMIAVIWSGGGLTQMAKGKGAVDKKEIKLPTPTKMNNTQAVLDELRAKLENSETPALSPSAGEQIVRWVITNGGSWGNSATWQVGATLGQPTVGGGNSSTYQSSSGFWSSGPEGGAGGCCDLAGDFNNDGAVDITDLTAVVDFMFAGGPPAVCPDEADLDASCTIDISDLTYRVEFMFGGGPAPVCGCAAR